MFRNVKEVDNQVYEAVNQTVFVIFVFTQYGVIVFALLLHLVGFLCDLLCMFLAFLCFFLSFGCIVRIEACLRILFCFLCVHILHILNQFYVYICIFLPSFCIILYVFFLYCFVHYFGPFHKLLCNLCDFFSSQQIFALFFGFLFALFCIFFALCEHYYSICCIFRGLFVNIIPYFAHICEHIHLIYIICVEYFLPNICIVLYIFFYIYYSNKKQPK